MRAVADLVDTPIICPAGGAPVNGPNNLLLGYIGSFITKIRVSYAVTGVRAAGGIITINACTNLGAFRHRLFVSHEKWDAQDSFEYFPFDAYGVYGLEIGSDWHTIQAASTNAATIVIMVAVAAL